MNFEWDENKALTNWKKHRVSFEEAKTIFDDPLSITIYDPEHSFNEGRCIDIGVSSKGRVLVVVYAERGKNTRLISCRKASAAERRFYEKQKN